MHSHSHSHRSSVLCNDVYFSSALFKQRESEVYVFERGDYKEVVYESCVGFDLTFRLNISCLFLLTFPKCFLFAKRFILVSLAVPSAYTYLTSFYCLGKVNRPQNSGS
jgi:hypothetical protein